MSIQPLRQRSAKTISADRSDNLPWMERPAIFSLPVLGLAVFLFGCNSMDHGSSANPSSIPIAPIESNSLFVVNGGGNSLTVINASTNEVTGTIALKNASFPHHLQLSPDGTTLALAIPGMDLSGGHEGSGGGGHGMKMKGAILLMEALTGKTLAARLMDGPNHNAIFSFNGREIWTSQMTMPGKVIVLDAADLAVKQSIAVGDMPAEVTFSPDGKYAFAANGMTNTVTVVDAATKVVVKTIAVDSNPVGAWTGLDGMMYVDNEMGKTITAFHGSTLEVMRTYALGFTPGMAATTSTGELWVTDAEHGKVVFYAAGDTAKIGETITGAGAHAIAFSGDGMTAYVSNQEAGTVSVLDIASHALAKNIAVGAKPNGMVFMNVPDHQGH